MMGLKLRNYGIQALMKGHSI